MSELFLTVLNMSLMASYVILFVILVRLFLKKAPKAISYALWGVVAFRLIIPFSFESIFSLMPRNANAVPIPHDIIYQQSPKINSGIEAVDSFVSQSLPAPTAGASVNPLQIYVEIGAYIWLLGIIALLVYSFVSILILKRQLKSAQLIERNIYESKNLKTPFVLGLIRPKIYLPVGLNASERSYILLHEQTHIHRKDHIIKVLAFLTLSIHWFNPLVWVAFVLMSTDMELSCDERVLKQMNNEDIKKPYANSLLSLATGKHIFNGNPLAFGEGNVRGRIKNVLNFKKPRFWIVVVSIIAVIIVGIALLANPLSEEAIFNNVLNGKNYGIYEIQKPISFTAYIEPTWFPENENEVINLNKEIGKVGQVGILLENVMHRGNDIYFNFDAKQFINYDSGEFLYHGTFNEDGTVTAYNSPNSFNIYDNKNNKIDVVGQTGFGPSSRFSFGIDIENYNVIKNGFILEFNGGILYGYSLEEMGDRNGFSLTDQEVARMLGYSTAYCFSTYKMDNGLYIIGFLADGKMENSDIGAGLFQFKDGEYQLISQTIHKEQALEQDRIVVGNLIAPSNKYYDVILSNNENLAEIRRTTGDKVVSEKVDRVNPSMTVIKLPETSSDSTYTFYDANGQQIDGYIPVETTKKAQFFKNENATKVELRSGNTGNTVEITDADNIQQITNAINSLQYEKGKSSKDSTGWSYSIKWYDKDGVLIEEIVILGSQTIDYEGKRYTVVNGNIDTNLLDDLLSKSANIDNKPIELDLVSGEYRAIWKESYKYDTPILLNNLIDLEEFLSNHPAQTANEDILQQNYNDGFFKHSVIYAYIRSEGSSSVKLTVKKAEIDGEILKLIMGRTVPENGTTDMATRICLFGINRDDIRNVNVVEGIILDV